MTILNAVIRAMTLSSIIGVLGVGSAMATTLTEVTDAGNTMATAIVLPAGTTSINGTIEDGQDTDLYKLTLDTDVTITIEMLFPSADANLIVFNGLGQGLAGDDDNESSCSPISSLGFLDSCLTLTLVAGDYFFGVGNDNIAAFESVADFNAANGTIDFIDNDFGILGSPTVETLGLIGREGGPLSDGDTGSYTVNLSIAAGGGAAPVPEPSTMLLLGTGLAGIIAWRRKQTA